MLALESCDVYPASALVKKQPEVKAAARERVVRITEHGRAAYVFASEEVFRREVAEAVPLDRMLIETDCPYLSPEPMRGRRNDSRNLPYIIEVLAQWKGVGAAEMERAAWENGKRLFGIG